MVDVIIFFVGLALWSDQVPDDGGVKAILPRVVHVNPNDPRTDLTAPLGDVPHVQNHIAAIVFSQESFDQQIGWETPKPIQRSNGPPFLYLKLDGDPIRFLTGLPRGVNPPASVTGMLLPQLTTLCPSKQTLRFPYTPPYQGAAAVIALPQGTLRACLSLPADSPGRLDTQLDLRTNGKLIISASTMLQTKELHLKPGSNGRIEIMIANVPEPFYQNNYTTPPPTALDGMSHMHVYYAMSDPPNSNNAACRRVEDWWQELQNPDPISLCDTLKFPASGPNVSQPSTAVVTSGASFDCSNSQWP